MSATRCVIGVDIGTTSTKAALYDSAGGVLAQHSVEYPLFTPVPGAAEQDPDQILNAVIEAIKRVGSATETPRIAAVSFSAAMHSLIAVDGKGEPLTRCITWADTRASAWAERIKQNGGQAIYARTGTPIHAMSPLAKLCWLRDTQRPLFDRAKRFISIKEYVFNRFFDRFIVDHSIASATGLFDISHLAWDGEALACAGVTPERLSDPVPTTYRLEGLDPEIARRTGLARDTPFVVGANDGVLANLGVNAIRPGAVAVTIGTSGAVRTAVKKPLTDPRGRLFCYVLAPGLWVIGGPVNNGGMILRWLRDQLASSEVETARRLGIDAYDVLTKIAERVSPGSDGLLFHPYLAGERAPLWNADARGSFFGLALHHRKEHMIRAVLEGVIFNLFAVLKILEEAAGRTEEVLATGGFARSRLWRQIMANIFNREIVVAKSPESSCLGAAVLGLYAVEAIPSLEAVAGMVELTERHRPDPANTKQYERLANIFLRVPDLLADAYRDIAEYQHAMPSEAGKG
jgi:gluconokinase